MQAKRFMLVHVMRSSSKLQRHRSSVSTLYVNTVVVVCTSKDCRDSRKGSTTPKEVKQHHWKGAGNSNAPQRTMGGRGREEEKEAQPSIV